MYIPRLLVPFFLVALSVVPLAAQSATGNGPASSQPELLQFGKVLQSAQGSIDASQLQAPPLLDESSVPGTIRAGGDEFNLTSRRRFHGLRSSVLAEDDSTCYFIRSYRVTRDDPESDSTTPSGYSTCLSGSRLQMRSTVESLEISPR